MFVLYAEDFPEECISDCSAPGHDASEAVEYWLSQTRQLDGIPREDIRKCLEGYGAWDNGELADDYENAKRLFWTAMCDFSEGEDIFAVE